MTETLDIRSDWTLADIEALYEMPLLDLVSKASSVHRAYHAPSDVQRATLMSIKTGACPEDCGYCPQSAHHKGVDLEKERLAEVEEVLVKAREAKASGATRFCMGAAWRNVREGRQFEAVLDMVRGVKDMGMEACVTLGMLDGAQAKALAEAGLTAYNHNIDTSPEYYNKIITTRTFQDRLDTLAHVREAGIDICSGGILGMGESPRDRCRMLQVLANLSPHPESVPINALVAVKGTPLEGQPKIDPLEMVRMVAITRILIPKCRVRLSAGRKGFSREAQVLCFVAGANSVFYGDKLLTTANNEQDEDAALLQTLGIEVGDMSAENMANLSLPAA